MAYQTDVTLVASRTDTAAVSATAGTAITVDTYRRGTFVLEATLNSGTCTITCTIQTYIGSNTWTDIARFTDVSSSTTRVFWNVGFPEDNDADENAIQTGTLTAGHKHPGPWGTQIRAYFTVTVSGSVTWLVKGTVQS